MNKDLILSLCLVGASVFLSVSGVTFPAVINTMANSRQLSTAFLLLSVGALYYYKYCVSALVAGILSVFLIKYMWKKWPGSSERQLYVDSSKDQARFDASTSIDLQFANKTVTHNLPHLLVKPYMPDLLEYPPQSDDLIKLSGSPYY